MEIKIGVQHASREIVIESDLDANAVAAKITGATGVIELHDTKGRTILIPAEKLAYVEIGSATTPTVGFRS